MKSADSVVVDVQRRADDATNELQSSRSEIQRLSTELSASRVSCDEMLARHNAAERDNKQLTGSLLFTLTSCNLLYSINVKYTSTFTVPQLVLCAVSFTIHYQLLHLLAPVA